MALVDRIPVDADLARVAPMDKARQRIVTKSTKTAKRTENKFVVVVAARRIVVCQRGRSHLTLLETDGAERRAPKLVATTVLP